MIKYVKQDKNEGKMRGWTRRKGPEMSRVNKCIMQDGAGRMNAVITRYMASHFSIDMASPSTAILSRLRFSKRLFSPGSSLQALKTPC